MKAMDIISTAATGAEKRKLFIHFIHTDTAILLPPDRVMDAALGQLGGGADPGAT